MLNTSDIRFDASARADAKIRFSLTPELQATVDYALSQSNAIQQEVIKRLFHQATKAKEKLGWVPEFQLKDLVDDMMASDLRLMQKDQYLRDGGYEILNYYE